eukprot:TRINITY_DN40070_c0_g1_i1.p1 TRINITY_DN40070_c0_g1~~TRINITY_DN40070_c0_g1_i1.p1  ORF type:complete len:247 (-),score=31.02 TRINITY_DN40070_c0_g1_i1:283-1023(-)
MAAKCQHLIGGGLESILPQTPTSFIRRCWWPERGCNESSACTDMRALFDAREDVSQLPPPGKCKQPKYIVTGSRYTNGFMEGNRMETLEFPGEVWHKCCFQEGSSKLQCETLETVPFHKLIQDHNGFCGTHKCNGYQDRCLVVDRQAGEFKAQKRGQCPGQCKESCERITQRLECVHLGNLPKAGTEGGPEAEIPKREFNEPEDYEVFSLSMPLELSMFGPSSGFPLCSMTEQRAQRLKNWSYFLG